MSQNNVSENMNLLNESESYIIFENQKIRDNVTNLNLDLNGNLNMDLNNVHFGILNIKTNKHDITILKKIQHIVFDVDCSGSMSDICNDKRSKMEHINHTIINMIMFIVEHPELMVFISVFAFDDKIYTIIENELISKENVETLVQQVRQIRPKNMTNIEKALTNSKEYIQKIDCDVIGKDNITITHIFMTDGDANEGITIPEDLLQKCDLSISNIFIGFGIDHNAHLLKVLSSSNKNKYYFVDALEKAGLVYGEILHSIIYKIMENISISVKNGYIYDWKKNVWTDKIIIDYLVSDINKVFHILSENPSECEVLIESNNYLINEHFQYNIKTIINENPVQLYKYKYRQRTQELMFEVSQHNFNNINIPVYNHNNNYSLYSDCNDNPFYKERNEKNALLKEKMNALLEEMKKYCQPESETESEKLDDMEKNFMKLLCDDIYMCLQTIDTRYGAMYSCSRQVSQGEQRSYSATQAPNMNLMKRCIIPKLHQRSYAFTGYNDDMLIHNFDYIEEQVEPEDKKEYTVSEDIDTNPYTNLSVLNLMRSCSSTIDDNKLFR
jgi:hypothetical protein